MTGQSNDYGIVVDDDPLICPLVSRMLDMKILPFSSAAGIMAQASRYKPKVVFLDINIGPDENGLDLIPKLRKIWLYVPIIVVTSMGATEVIAESLASGANDFIRKPFDREELTARVTARIAEASMLKDSDVQEFGDLRVFTRQNFVEGPLGSTHMPMAEINVLHTLLSAQGNVVSRNAVLREVWGHTNVSANAVDKRIHSIRSSLKDVTQDVSIKSVYGKGFCLFKKTA
jgi:two-component system, OmpR family, KDP operon response regulator KdpE